MSTQGDAGPAIVEFAAYSEGGVGADTVGAFVSTLALFAQDRDWLLSAPEPVDDVVEGIRVVGLVHRIYGAAALHLTLEIRYDDENVGWIDAGVVDDSITDGLIGEWVRHTAPPS
jgi:hypothetical protein